MVALPGPPDAVSPHAKSNSSGLKPPFRITSLASSISCWQRLIAVLRLLLARQYEAAPNQPLRWRSVPADDRKHRACGIVQDWSMTALSFSYNAPNYEQSRQAWTCLACAVYRGEFEHFEPIKQPA